MRRGRARRLRLGLSLRRRRLGAREPRARRRGRRDGRACHDCRRLRPLRRLPAERLAAAQRSGNRAGAPCERARDGPVPRAAVPARCRRRPCHPASAYGYGLVDAADATLGRRLHHPGGLPGYGSHMLFLPERGIGVFAFANRTYAPMSRLTLRLAELFLGSQTKPAPLPRRPGSSAPSRRSSRPTPPAASRQPHRCSPRTCCSICRPVFAMPSW